MKLVESIKLSIFYFSSIIVIVYLGLLITELFHQKGRNKKELFLLLAVVLVGFVSMTIQPLMQQSSQLIALAPIVQMGLLFLAIAFGLWWFSLVQAKANKTYFFLTVGFIFCLIASLVLGLLLVDLALFFTSLAVVFIVLATWFFYLFIMEYLISISSG